MLLESLHHTKAIEEEVLTLQGLNETAKGQISPTKWYLGGSAEYTNISGPASYNFERGAETCANTTVSGDDYLEPCSGETGSTFVVQSVGLMYPSDFIYTYAYGVNDKCYNSGDSCSYSDEGIAALGWLFKRLQEWTITPAEFKYANFMLFFSGAVGTDVTTSSNNLRPTVYLRSDIETTGGNGSLEKPYQLSV